MEEKERESVCVCVCERDHHYPKKIALDLA